MAVQRNRHGTRGRGNAQKNAKASSGPRKTLREMGVERVASARELFARELRKQLKLYHKRRVVRKQGFWDLRTMQARYRSLPEATKAMWVAQATKQKELRRALLRGTTKLDTDALTPAGAPAASPPDRRPAGVRSCATATTTWLRLDCCAESPGHASEFSEAARAAVDASTDLLEWVESESGGLRSLRRVPGEGGELGGGSYGSCYVYEDEDTGERWCAKLQRAPRDRSQEESCRRELKISRACNHTNLLRA